MTEPTDQTGHDAPRSAAPLLRASGRVRTGIVLAVTLIGFAAVNAFWQYLVTGRWLDVSAAAYRRGLTTPLSEMFIQPLSIFNHPWMIVVSAMLLAAVMIVPILIAVLYHDLLAMLFVLVVAGIGHTTVLAVFLAGGCVLAARTRLRRDIPFLATLLGMAPLGVYFASGVAGFPAPQPLQRWILSAPVVAAVLLAIVAAAAVLSLARLMRFRPGVLWPVLAVLLAGPMAIFYTKVGADELQYAVIANPLAGADALFESMTLEDWRKDNQAEGLNRYTLKTALAEDLDLRKRRLIQQCQRFLAVHAQSDRAAAVLWIEAQAHSLLLDEAAYEAAYEESEEAGLVKYSAMFPLPASRATWQRLGQEYPGSPHAALAGWRLGELALRAGQVKQADERLQAAVGRLQALLADVAARRRGRQPATVFAPAEAVPAQRDHQYYEKALLAVERLAWLMEQNDALGDPKNAEALAAYLNLNPRAADYAERLAELAGRYESTRMGDNLKLAVAKATPNHYQRAEMLIALAENKTSDAAIEANFALGNLAMKTAQARVLSLIEKLREPEEYFKRVIDARENPWQRRAHDRLAWLAAQPKQAP